jgi:hypothetical protein
MKRDITVPISAVLLLMAIGALIGYEMLSDTPLSGKITKESPEWQIVTFAVIGIAGMRTAILWFQTLFDAIRPANQSGPRYGWLVSHFVFLYFTPYFYYFAHRTPAKRN